MFSHIPVLLEEVIDALDIQPGKHYIDATLGGAGHTQEILKRGGKVLGIDQDEDALGHVREIIQDKNLTIAKGNFRNIKSIAEENGCTKVAGVLFDLGVSSYQLDEDRGFSIRRDEKLDMRMDRSQRLSAADVVNGYPPEDLVEIFMAYGEEEKSKEVAEKIVFERKKARIETTGQLVDVIRQVIKPGGKVHPATRIFQAIRIEVNDELGALKEGLQGALELLNKDGRIAVISFHSLEDRIIKRTFEAYTSEGFGETIHKKPVTAGEEELRKNPRARSAKLRVFKKTI
ncbi:MAG: 16S rRNA (cytosine(1402)-N(4))-methyltransferase RsmH [Candidatus Levyibacteriota bacterium]